MRCGYPHETRMGPLLGIHFIASMVSMFVMILAPDVQFVGMAALCLQLRRGMRPLRHIG
jgi:hypothetical protein